MELKEFSNGLVVKHRKSAIIFENAEGKEEGEVRFLYDFTKKELKEFATYIEQAANEAWKNVIPKEATSAGSDYDEYYDWRYEDNGYLSFTKTGIVIDAPHWSVDTLYQFNKAKIQSFIFDIKLKLI